MKAIVLGADNAYVDKVTTTIKSICAHNKEIVFYVLNDDIASEWFDVMNHRLEKIHSKVVNVKITEHPLKNFSTPDWASFNYAAFFRYYIPHFVFEEKALYLDSDIIVTGSLEPLFELDLEGFPLAAVQDVSAWGVLETFNSGVMLIDTNAWRAENSLEHLMLLTKEHHTTTWGDQGILNMYFENRWKKLGKTYNYMVGLDSIVHTLHDGDISWYNNHMESLPVIIHYTAGKPWQMMNQNRFKDVWWFYYGLDWSDILLGSYALKGGYDSIVKKFSYSTAIFTNSADIRDVEYLVEQLPEVRFHILAHTNFAASIIDLQRCPNVSVYPVFNPFVKESVLNEIDFYLDINYHDEIIDIVNLVHSMAKPVLAFQDTSHDGMGRSQIVNDRIEMVESIRSLLKNKK